MTRLLLSTSSMDLYYVMCTTRSSYNYQMTSKFHAGGLVSIHNPYNNSFPIVIWSKLMPEGIRRCKGSNAMMVYAISCILVEINEMVISLLMSKRYNTIWIT